MQHTVQLGVHIFGKDPYQLWKKVFKAPRPQDLGHIDPL